MSDSSGDEATPDFAQLMDRKVVFVLTLTELLRLYLRFVDRYPESELEMHNKQRNSKHKKILKAGQKLAEEHPNQLMAALKEMEENRANIITRGLEAYTGDLEETSKAFVSMVAAANEFLEILKALCAELDRCYQRRVGESDAHTKELEQFYEEKRALVAQGLSEIMKHVSTQDGLSEQFLAAHQHDQRRLHTASIDDSAIAFTV